MNKYFVKFVPWNERTIESLINKTIKFSTVFEFNDFNEYRYISPGNADIQGYLKNNGIKEILSLELYNSAFRQNLSQLAKERYSVDCYNEIHNLLKSGEHSKLLDQNEKYFGVLQESLAFFSVGIFCMSDLEVFEDDSAQLMFAHYSRNLEGLALIYEINSSTSLPTVKYDGSNISSSGLVKRIFNWYDEKYSDIDDFLHKSPKWSYEKEKRIFAKPGIKPAAEHGIELKAIFYTSRFKGRKLTLKNIRENLYYGNVLVEKICPSLSKPCFVMEDKKKNPKTSEFMEKHFGINHHYNATIRPSHSDDINTLVSLSYIKRRDYEKAQPLFWRYAGSHAEESQAKWFRELLAHKDYIMLTAEMEGKIVGFIIGKLMPAPEVYDPGGLTLIVDDFCVKTEDLWKSVGAELIAEIKAIAKSKGAVQILVVAGHHDNAKCNFLRNQELTIASEWFVGGII